MEIDVCAWAKLNLSLDVVKKLPNGYHDMRVVMETVELHDDVHISVRAGKGIWMETNFSYLPVDDRNIAVLAAKVFFRELNLPERQVAIRIHKRVPVAAGMAGGSANAAAVIPRRIRIFLSSARPPRRSCAETGGFWRENKLYWGRLHKRGDGIQPRKSCITRRL